MRHGSAREGEKKRVKPLLHIPLTRRQEVVVELGRPYYVFLL